MNGFIEEKSLQLVLVYCCEVSREKTYHASARILPNKRVSQDLGEFTGSEWMMGLIATESPDTLL